MRRVSTFGSLLLAAMALAGPASAGDAFGLALKGSFGPNGFDRYVPPINNPVFNETPFITTEIKPFYAYHSIPGSFPTNGGNVQVAGVQARLALTDRLGLIATTDGYSWLDFDDESLISDTDGWNDIAIGFKYALISNPETGGIVTAGLRYTIPVGDIELGNLELNGIGAGYVNPFVTAAKIVGDLQFQGMAGAQLALDDDATSWLLASGNIDYEIAPGWYPSVGYNLFIPINGGDRLQGSTLTGADLFDFGSSDPQTIFAIGGGLRYRASDNVLIGFGGDYNALEDSDHVYGWRLLADLVIHY